MKYPSMAHRRQRGTLRRVGEFVLHTVASGTIIFGALFVSAWVAVQMLRLAGADI
jgi:hypothetical protein